jgi:F-box and WD-40 domain protein 1/11
MSLRPASPVSTVDFSIINVDPDDVEANPFIPGDYPSTQPRLISSPMAGIGFSRGRSIYANSSGAGLGGKLNNSPLPEPSPNSFKAFLPRLWDTISSPVRNVMNFSSSTNVIATPPPSQPSLRAASPSASPRPLHSQSWYTNNGASNGRHASVCRNTNKGKGKSKGGGFFAVRSGNNSRRDLNQSINYSELAPLDGEEGELIDDEACFIDIRAITGIGSYILLMDKANT